MGVYNREGVWCVDSYFEGRRLRESTRCTSKRAAERYLAARLTDIERGQFNLGKVQKKLRIFLAFRRYPFSINRCCTLGSSISAIKTRCKPEGRFH